MAPEALNESFAKIRIEPPHLPKRAASTFAALTLHKHGEQPAASSTPNLHTLPSLSTEPLVFAHPPSSEEHLSYKLSRGEDIEDDAKSEVSETAVSSTESDNSREDSSLRVRAPSISFAKQVTLENGDKRPVDEPFGRSDPVEVPISGSYGVPILTPERYRTGFSESAHTYEKPYHGHAILGDSLPLDRRRERARPTLREGGRRHPLLYTPPQTPEIPPEIPQSDEADQVSSQTSEATVASPTSDEVRTSFNSTLLSPINTNTTSPISVSPFFVPRSARSMSNNRSDRSSMASTRRRSSRSASSSMSPASAFLFGMARATASEDIIEPDDEGQEIGDKSGWIIGRKIGYGGFSTVKEVSTIESKTGKRIVRAVKIVRKNPKAARDELENERIQAEIEHEVRIWRFLRNRFIVPLIAVYDTPFATFCITRLNIGGTLHSVIRSRRQQYKEGERGLPAHIAKRYTYQLASAIRYLHEDVHVVHRDVKLENVLLDMSAPDSASQGGNVLLCDFGMADFIHLESRDGPDPDLGSHNRNIGPSDVSSYLHPSASNTTLADTKESTISLMGSLEYAAPELINAPSTLYSPAADIWAFGIVVYALLTGSLPFTHAMPEKLVVMIEKMQWDSAPLYYAPAVRNGGIAGTAAVELVQGCLTFGAEEGERWDIRKVLNARWLVNCEEMYGDGSVKEGEVWE
ncbi:CAMK protein kinase [Venturia nashicola]|uniref:CAMK protein kinase n=1 Tax=Venturia nashicola TaxID=86259 RepID=A0A4Z1NSP8_9PEZI|nr:CAMK protein kinase [Venturia nashicola]